MRNKNIIKKKIIYRSNHRGSKEMDLLLGNFTNKYIDDLNKTELRELEILLNFEDEILYNLYYNKNSKIFNKLKNITKKFRDFKL